MKTRLPEKNEAMQKWNETSRDGMDEELQRFHGTWKQIFYERDGVTDPPDEQGWDPITTFTAAEFVVTLADGSIPIKGTYRIDPTRNPKAVDWMDTIGEDAGKTLLAIYAFQEDRLIFCAAYPGRERPTEFRTRPGQVLRVFQREAGEQRKMRAHGLREVTRDPNRKS